MRAACLIVLAVVAGLCVLTAIPPSAVLTISACSTDSSTGTVSTCTVSGGGAGSLSPTSGITGFIGRLTVNGVVSHIAVASVTASGTGAAGTAVITFQTPVLSGETVTLDWAATSNLTDGTNTAQGQTAVAVSNNSPITGTTISTSAANVYLQGNWTQGTCAGFGGRNCLFSTGFYSQTVIKGTGTDVAADFGDGTIVDVSVDGAATSAKSAPSTSTLHYTWTALASGLSNTSHTITITSRNTPTAYFDRTNSIRFSSNTGATCCADIPANDGTWYVVGTTPFTSSSRSENSFLGTDGGQNGYGGALYWPGGLGDLRWNACAMPSLYAWAYNGSGKFALYMDGTQIGSLIVPPGGSHWAPLTFAASGLDPGCHMWEIVATATAGSYIYGLLLPAGATLGSQPALKLLATCYGDSICAGVGITGYPSDIRAIDYWFRDTGLSYVVYESGNPSQPVSTVTSGSGTSGFLKNNTAQISTRTPPTIAIAQGAVNDEIFSGFASPSDAGSTFTADHVTMLNNLAARMQAGGKLLVRGILPYIGTNSANRLSWEAAQSASTTTYNSAPINAVTACFYNTDGWIGAGDWSDNLHPNDAGNAKVRAREIPIVAGAASSSYTISGPSSGKVGITSTAYTITMANGATFASGQKFPISDGGKGGTITPSAGSPGTSSVTFDVSSLAGSTSATFTYRPLTPGATTLTVGHDATAQQCWTDPAPLTVTVIPRVRMVPIILASARSFSREVWARFGAWSRRQGR